MVRFHGSAVAASVGLTELSNGADEGAVTGLSWCDQILSLARICIYSPTTG